MTKLDKIIEKIRELRDASFHVCPNTTNDELECTCHHFDEVIDELEKLRQTSKKFRVMHGNLVWLKLGVPLNNEW